VSNSHADSDGRGCFAGARGEVSSWTGYAMRNGIVAVVLVVVPAVAAVVWVAGRGLGFVRPVFGSWGSLVLVRGGRDLGGEYRGLRAIERS
jgi:hypothetical protein